LIRKKKIRLVFKMKEFRCYSTLLNFQYYYHRFEVKLSMHKYYIHKC
jgi:hypothetical protein